MLTIKGEYYTNDYNNRAFTQKVSGWDAVYDMLLNHVNGNTGSKDNKNLTFNNFEKYGKNHIHRMEAYECCSGKESLWIHLIESDRGIEFSDGKYTSHQTHASGEFCRQDKRWCERLEKSFSYNFVA